MAYEIEKNRMADIISSATRVSRIRDAALEREATERAFEARQQVGLVATNTDADKIVHPTPAQRISRLGVPSTVGTAELAIWKYLVHDPIASLANGLLNSAEHRAVLDNPYFDYWGIGIYSEMPSGETSEFLRRWYGIIWLSNVAISTAAVTQPSQFFAKKVGFAAPGRHWGYIFDYKGSILDAKSLNLSRPSSATTKGRGKIPGRAGDFLLINDGYFAGYWVPEISFVTAPSVRLS